jgi:hypothetical protein
MRLFSKIAVLAVVLSFAGFVGITQASGAVAEPVAPNVNYDGGGEGFPPCDAQHDGATWVDPSTGKMWRCQLVHDPYIGFYWDWRQVQCKAAQMSAPDVLLAHHRWN